MNAATLISGRNIPPLKPVSKSDQADRVTGNSAPSQEQVGRVLSNSSARSAIHSLQDNARFAASIKKFLKSILNKPRPVLFIFSFGLICGGAFISGASWGYAAPLGLTLLGIGFALLAACFSSEVLTLYLKNLDRDSDESTQQEPPPSAQSLADQQPTVDLMDDWSEQSYQSHSDCSYFDWQAKEQEAIFTEPEDFDILQASHVFGAPDFQEIDSPPPMNDNMDDAIDQESTG